MKVNNAMNLAAIAFVGIAPATVAMLGTSCIEAFNAINKVPGLLIEHTQQQACAAGCQPTIETWSLDVKHRIVADIVDDGARYCQVSEGKAEFIKFIDKFFDSATANCKDHLEGKHLCSDPDSVTPFINCVKNGSLPAVSGNMGELLPYMSEKTCKKAAEYFTGKQLWEEDFPKHIRTYVDQCHEL